MGSVDAEQASSVPVPSEEPGCGGCAEQNRTWQSPPHFMVKEFPEEKAVFGGLCRRNDSLLATCSRSSQGECLGRV